MIDVDHAVPRRVVRAGGGVFCLSGDEIIGPDWQFYRVALL